MRNTGSAFPYATPYTREIPHDDSRFPSRTMTITPVITTLAVTDTIRSRSAGFASRTLVNAGRRSAFRTRSAIRSRNTSFNAALYTPASAVPVVAAITIGGRFITICPTNIAMPTGRFSRRSFVQSPTSHFNLGMGRSETEVPQSMPVVTSAPRKKAAGAIATSSSVRTRNHAAIP